MSVPGVHHGSRADGAAVAGARRFRTEASDLVSTVGRFRIPEFVLFFGLIFEGSLFGLPLPFNQLVMMAIIGLAVIRRPQVTLGKLQFIVPLLVIALFYITVISLYADPTEFASDWKRRLIRLVLTAVLVVALSSGRIDFRSAIAGLGTGMLFNAVAFEVGLAPDYYGGFLSGFFEDKNVAGMAYAVFGVLMLAAIEKRWLRILLLLVFTGLVWDTGSRTSFTAFAAGALWVLIAPRLPVLGRWIMGALIVAGTEILAEDFSQIGVFSDRDGSDLLRSRIDAASEIKVEEAGFFGSGLGEAYIRFEDEPSKAWYFHNSYWSALVEGGWPWLILVVGITAVFALRPFTKALDSQEIAAQAATVALLICAWRLGEVLFTVQWAVVVGFAIYLHASREARATDPAEDQSSLTRYR